ncbi:MAG TPA: ferrous iron transport protein B [Caldisericia bacterium]|nr:ferrous iron transport protein B [Caldisericia bacterium]HPB34282.1 ferrous iron transport protein B [Caldisericia bacterium]HQL66669.1 ferrous iron transport protein B [Caldisericia bacterium]HQN48099.1 ferrous iron transport protein B [Caldisericia bacterium]HQP00036.1 ferrous iron transport protein B [Caldisericia bacterium]
MGEEKELTIALAGNANVGKSAIFNQLTGSHQIIGNWPGKTIEKSEGYLIYKGYKIKVVDLPGIYSFSTYSEEELISRDFIAKEKPDIVINVVDALHLERNLFFTLQLIELEAKLVIALNQVDLLEKSDFTIDSKKLENILNIPVIPTIAIEGKGIEKLIEKCIEIYEGKIRYKPIKIEYGKEVEERINELFNFVPYDNSYPKRWFIIKLLEGDEEIKKLVEDKKILEIIEKKSKELEEIHGEPISLILTQEKYNLSNKITREVLIKKEKRVNFSDLLDKIFLHPIFGYFTLIISLFLIFYLIFKFGNFVSGHLESFFELIKNGFLKLNINETLKKILWDGIGEGVIGGISIALPYLIPFYILLSILEDSGYLSRMAFLTDSFMHFIGLHGKAFFPLMLGFGCNVPAVLGSRILETKKQKFIVSTLATLVPCSARTIIIIGLVGIFLGFKYVLIVYIIDIVIIILFGILLSILVPGKSYGLIMEIPPLRKPSTKIVLKQSWFRIKDFIYFAFPIIVFGSFLLQILDLTNLLNSFVNLISPFFISFLGLPPLTSIPLIFGILRKELTLIMLFSLFGTTNVLSFMTPKQIIIYSLITLFYFPCVATFAVLKKEIALLNAILIAVFEMIFAFLLGGFLNLVL